MLYQQALSFSHSQIFISSYVKLMLDLVWTLCYWSQTCHCTGLHHSIPLGVRPFFFRGPFPPKESHRKCFHRNSALCQRQCCGCAAEPTGRRCPSPRRKCNRSFHPLFQIFQRGLIHCGILETGLLITTGPDNERS